jgi:hypothetical protein
VDIINLIKGIKKNNEIVSVVIIRSTWLWITGKLAKYNDPNHLSEK